MEMESIKPSFDVLLQTGLHRGSYGHNFYKKRRPRASKGLHKATDKAGRRGHGAGRDDAADSQYSGDLWHSRSPTVYGDSEKQKTYDRQQDRDEARRVANFRALSPVRHYKTPETDDSMVAGARSLVTSAMSMMKADASPGSRLSATVMRASRQSTDSSSSRPTYATLPRSYRHYPGASVISVEELPRPQRGTYHIAETDQTLTADDYDSEKQKTYVRQVAKFRSLSPTRHYKSPEIEVAGARSTMKAEASPGSRMSGIMVMRASRQLTDDVNDASSSLSRPYATLPRSHRHYPGTAVIKMEEIPRPQRGTYHVAETEQTLTDNEQAWSARGSGGWRLTSQSDGPHLGVRPLSVHDDELMSYLREKQTTPDDFTLNAILANQEGSKRQHQRAQSVPTSPANIGLYTVNDDEIGQLHRLLDNPFIGHAYERSFPKQVRLYVLDFTWLSLQRASFKLNSLYSISTVYRVRQKVRPL